MIGDDLNDVAYQMRRDMEIERAARARVAYGDAMAHSEISPEFAAEQLKLARKGKGGDATPEQVEQNKLEEEYDWRADPRFVGEYNARIAEDAKFAHFIKGDIRNVSMFEKAWHKLSGDDGEAKTLGKAFRNSLARGGRGLLNTMPIFGNVRELEDVSKEIEYIEQGRKALAEGKAAEFFGTEEDPQGLAGSYQFGKDSDKRYAELVERRRLLSGAVARQQQISALYPQSEAMKEFQNTKGLGEAAGWALTHPLEMLSNTGPEMAVQMAPMLMLGFAGSAGGLAAVAGIQGLYSYGMDSASSILEYMGEAGIDTTDDKAIEKFFSNRNDPTFTKVMQEAYSHAGPTALLDALSAPMALLRMPGRITGRLYRIAPSASRAYNSLMAAPRVSRITNAILQTQVQGVMGGAGEALGQIAAKGEITSYADIVAEYVGEHFSAPFEMLNAARAASADLAMLKARNDNMQRTLHADVDAAQASTSLPLDPESHNETLRRAGEQSEQNDPVEEALWQRIPFNPEMLSNEVKAQLAQESPAFAEALRQAEETGEEASIAYPDFITQVARSEVAHEFVDATHVPLEMSNGEIEMVALNQAEEAAQDLAEDQRATFSASLKAVGKQIASMLESVPEPGKGRKQHEGEMGVSEKKAVAALVLSHVSAMARDLGITPEEAWQKYGMTGVLSEKAGQFQAGQMTAQSKRRKSGATAKNRLSEDSRDWSDTVDRLKGTVPGDRVQMLRYTPSVLRMLGFNVDRGVFAVPHFFDHRKHPTITDEMVKKIPAALTDPIAIFKSATEPGRLVVMLGIKDENGATVVVPVGMDNVDFMGGGALETVTLSYSDYPKVNEANQPDNQWFANEAEAGRLLYVNTETASVWALTSGSNSLHRLPTPASQGSVKTQEDLVKYKHEHKGVYEGDEEGAVRGAYVPEMRKILLTARSDKSTFLHETGHWFLDARVRIALELKKQTDLTDAQKRFLDLTEKTIAWLMPGKTLEEFAAMPLEKGEGPRRSADEKFARTYEAYLLEGNAPTGALLSIFRKFSGWLKAIYTSIAGIPEARLSDDVRELFDGLFVASEQAREAILYRGIYRATEKYIRGESEVDDIKQAIADAYADLEESVREKILAAYTRDVERLRDLRKGEVRKLSEKGKKILKDIQDGIRKRVSEEPDQKAYKALTEGRKVGKTGVRKLRILSTESRTVGGINLYMTPDELIAGGDEYLDMDGQELAELLGFSSEDEMVQALENRRPIEDIVNEEAANRFMEEHGELATPEAIQRTADLAIYSEAMERLLSNELGGMDKAMGNKTQAKTLLKPIVEAVIGRTRLRDLKPRNYRADATRAANRALAFLTGKRASTSKKTGRKTPAISHDTIAAAREKRRQLFHSMKADMAQKTRDKIAKRVAVLKKLAAKPEVKGMRTEYLEMVEVLCLHFGLIDKRSKNTLRETSWEKFAAEQEAKGIPMPDFPEQKDSFGAYTINEVNAILEGIETVAAIGKGLETVRKGAEEVSVKKAQDELAQVVADNANNRGLGIVNEQSGEGKESKARAAFRKFFMTHRRIASFFQCMEGKQFGLLWEYIIRPFDEAGNREIQMKAELSEKAAKLFEPLRKLGGSHKRTFRKHLDGSFSDAEVLAMALNLNSEENLQRLLAGSDRYKGRKGKALWTAEDVINTVAETLTEEQLRAVQQIWDLCGSLWGDIVALEHETNHRSPKPVEPRVTTFTLPDGKEVTLKGGYYPVRYDKRISRAATKSIDDDHADALSSMTGRPKFPDRTHTHERVAGVPPGRAIELTLTAGFSGLDSVVHDLCWRKPLAQADKLFASDGAFRGAVADYWGSEAVEEINTWLADIAAGGRGQSESSDVIANALRSNISLAGIGFNLVTAAVQLTGMTQSVVALGPKWAGVGIGEFMKGPKKALEFARGKSQLMADRARTQFRELGEIHSSISGTVSEKRGLIMKYAYMPIVFVQTMVDVPTWLGGYHKALADGCSEPEAIARADRMLIDSQGSGRLQDLSGVERGGPWKKLFTVFYTFFNTTYNLALVKGQTETGMKRAANLLALLAIQPVLEGFLREALKVGGDDDDDDPYKYLKLAGKSAVSFNMGMLVGVRELSGMIDGFGYRGPTGMRKINDLNKLYEQGMQGEFDEGLAKAAVNVGADWFGIPAVPINRAISGTNALLDDETDNWLAPFLGYSKY